MIAAGASAGIVERVLRGLVGALAGVGAAALAGIFLLVFAAVVMRYVWGRPFGFTEELSGLLMTITVFTLLPATVLHEINIRVTVLSERLPARGQSVLHIIGQMILIAFCIIFVREAWAIYDFTARLRLMSEQSRLPLAPFLFIATGSMAVAALAGAWRALRPSPPVTGPVHA